MKTMLATNECIFCISYENYKKKDLIIFENDGAYSVFNYKPSTPGHALIITKKHIINLNEIQGQDLEEFIHAIPPTFSAIQEIYAAEPTKLTSFYETLLQKPPENSSDVYAQQMLNDPDILKKPVAYNWGMNYGYDAGQRAIHLHIHLFPRREQGLGIATAMRKHLKKED